MNLKKVHYISGVTITIFIGVHLFNHFISILGADVHIEVMSKLRLVYRNVFVSIDLALTPQLTEVDPPEKNGVIKIKKRSLRTFS